jgi:alkanesulfonate monooxygenase SsuD/methylene tetrahydromethanopterin reductase-like flavin-dependent oxidoreductase (luciferase family)
MDVGLLLHTRQIIRQEDAAKSFDQLWADAARAEELGFDHIWLGDSVTVLEKARGDCLTTMAALAARTEKIKIGAVPMLPALRNPVLLAHALATLDVISKGRIILGVSVGPVRDYIQRQFAGGVPPQEKAGRLGECIEIMRRLWSETAIDYDGRYYKLNDVGILPHPAQPQIPIWIAADRHENGFRRVGRLGDGWVTLAPTLEKFITARQKVDRYAEEHGRTGKCPVSALYATFNLQSDGDRARDEGWKMDGEFFSATQRKNQLSLHHFRYARRVRELAEGIRKSGSHHHYRPHRVR